VKKKVAPFPGSASAPKVSIEKQCEFEEITSHPGGDEHNKHEDTAEIAPSSWEFVGRWT
jgi:hypothetical protein